MSAKSSSERVRQNIENNRRRQAGIERMKELWGSWPIKIGPHLTIRIPQDYREGSTALPTSETTCESGERNERPGSKS